MSKVICERTLSNLIGADKLSALPGKKESDMSTNNDSEMDLDVMSETENFAIWRSQEGDGFTYHLELGGLTLHLESEEWEELTVLFKSVA